MLSRTASLLGKLLIVLGIIGYQILAHSAFREHQNPVIHFVLLMLPLVLIGCWILVSVKKKAFWLCVLILSGALLYVIDQQDNIGLAAVYGLPHAITYLSLLWFFGRTLRAGETPLITRLATKFHGTLPDDMKLYTRRITAIWCGFFAGQVIISGLLYCFASIDHWSLFINILNLPLLIIMFVGDYLYRICRFRHHPQASISKAIQSFMQDSSFFQDNDKG